MVNPVLIVGAGPTGMTAALELSRMGVRVRLIDKTEAPAEGAAPLPERSRAIGVQARTLELMDMRGLSQEMVRHGHPTAGAVVYGVIQSGRYRGYMVANQRVLPTSESDEPSYPIYPFFLFSPQGEKVQQLGDETEDLQELLSNWEHR